MNYGYTPVLLSSNLTYHLKDNLFANIAEFILPRQLTEIKKISCKIKYFLANHSRLYLFIGLSFRSIGTVFIKDERLVPICATQSCVAQDMCWRVTFRQFKKFADLAKTRKFIPIVLIYADFPIRGLPINNIKRILHSLNIKYFDMSPYWKNSKNFVERYTLKWDSHPNVKANQLTIEKLTSFLTSMHILPDYNHKLYLKHFLEYVEIIEKYEKQSQNKEKKQIQKYKQFSNKFSDIIDFSKKGTFYEDQISYGWWNKQELRWHKDETRWISNRATVILNNKNHKKNLVIEGRSINNSFIRKKGLTLFLFQNCKNFMGKCEINAKRKNKAQKHGGTEAGSRWQVEAPNLGVSTIENYQIIKSPNYQITKLSNHQITKLPNRQSSIAISHQPSAVFTCKYTLPENVIKNRILELSIVSSYFATPNVLGIAKNDNNIISVAIKKIGVY